MQIRAVLALLSALASLACARPSGSTDAQVALGPPQPDSQLVEAAGPPRYRPVVIWHGLGDWYSSEGMTELAADLERRFPSLFVYNAHISDDAGKDRNAGFYGNVNEQIEAVADELEALPELADGYDAIGFSQGGQFLRALVELRGAPVHNLITFGAQHMGISDLPACAPNDLICKLARAAAFRGVYSDYAQTNLVQAQYFRDQDRLDLYYRSNTFLAVINNELDDKDASYKANLGRLEHFVMLQFRNETTVSPPISSHFGSLEPLPAAAALTAAAANDDDGSSSSSSGGSPLPPARKPIPLRESRLYADDWLGLRALDARGALEFGWCDGAHMQISLERGGCWDRAVTDWLGNAA